MAIPLCVILGQYKLFGISLGLLMLSFSILYVVIKQRKILFYKPIFVFFIFMACHDLLKNFFTQVNVFLWIERIVFFVFLCCVIGNVDSEKLFRAWKNIGIIAMIGLYIQAVQVYIFGQSVGMIRLIPIGTSTAKNFTEEYMRPHSIFLEPASYATWMLPLLCMLIVRKRYVFAIVVTLSILLSSSSIGIMMTSFIWLYSVVKDLKYYNTRRTSLILITVLFVGVIAFTQMSVFSTSLEKLTSISSDNTSNYVRTSLGFDLYKDASVGSKIMGIPYQTVEAYLKQGEISLKDYGLSYDLSYLGFVNGLSSCMLYYGLIGLILFLYMYYLMFYNIDFKYKEYVLVCFMSLFAQSVFWNTVFVTQMAFILAFIDKENTFAMGDRREQLIR